RVGPRITHWDTERLRLSFPNSGLGTGVCETPPFRGPPRNRVSHRGAPKPEFGNEEAIEAFYQPFADAMHRFVGRSRCGSGSGRALHVSPLAPAKEINLCG